MHIPVLLQEVIDSLRPQPNGVYIDGTVGTGGHAAAILTASTPGGILYGCDRDKDVLEIARRHLAKFGDRGHLLHSNFSQLSQLASQFHIPPADGILLDLGVSSVQLEEPARGFSFQRDGPLDMRMNPATGRTAADLVNHLSEAELAKLIYRYGEEPNSRRIARAIVKVRPIQGTVELAQIVAGAILAKAGQKGSRRARRRIHPATRTFQALRIAVNDELAALQQGLPQAVALLKPAGRLAVISFNSLEDRIVKQYFRQEATDCICPPEQPICTCRHKAIINILSKKPIIPTSAEVDANPRARSAKLRVVELRKG